MNLTVFCSQRLESSSTPGATVNQINLVGVRGANNETPGPNDALFGTEQQQVNMNLQGLTADAQAVFKAGSKYQIAITEITE